MHVWLVSNNLFSRIGGSCFVLFYGCLVDGIFNPISRCFRTFHLQEIRVSKNVIELV